MYCFSIMKEDFELNQGSLGLFGRELFVGYSEGKLGAWMKPRMYRNYGRYLWSLYIYGGLSIYTELSSMLVDRPTYWHNYKTSWDMLYHMTINNYHQLLYHMLYFDTPSNVLRPTVFITSMKVKCLQR
ncbi:hypothetical protein LXG23DRAFT_38010 [Yarrowia lipolytica]|nr:hypothetical protein BKA91DRAFT_129847 [Yarrowia lipolytica]KAE8172896.1 hypothetical protein BKA90DRAFT_128268 [Yarrowia lipolytica]KAJ8051950.1 hypothetical protein LXG23DRAFT_38010 [Yarrowia lipolytica]RMJ00659.1 hypothetical protein BD777DRAFT_132546 [Yarrowia lipolytica]